MYFFDLRVFGYELSFVGKISTGELSSWLEVARALLPSVPRDFGVLVDLRFLAPLEPACFRLLGEGMRLFQQNGLRRSAVVVANACLRREFAARARLSGADRWERYFCVDETPDWRERGVLWICQGKDEA